jgi:hypothetical protein
MPAQGRELLLDYLDDICSAWDVLNPERPVE